MEHSDLNALGTLMSNMGWILTSASEAGVSYLGFQISWEALSGTDFGKTVFLTYLYCLLSVPTITLSGGGPGKYKLELGFFDASEYS